MRSPLARRLSGAQDDVTVDPAVALSGTDAAGEMAGIEAEIIDARTLVPFDYDTASVR